MFSIYSKGRTDVTREEERKRDYGMGGEGVIYSVTDFCLFEKYGNGHF